jgi:hypothetical protein
MTALLCPCALFMEAFILALRLSPRLSGYWFFHSHHEKGPAALSGGKIQPQAPVRDKSIKE